MTSSRRDEWLAPVLAQLCDEHGLDELRHSEESLWEGAVRRSLTTDDAILGALAARYHVPAADLSIASVEAREAVAEAVARRYHIVPLAVTDSTIEIATANPNDLDCEHALGFATGRRVRMRLASPTAIAARIDELYSPEAAVERVAEDIVDTEIETLNEIPDPSDFDLGSENAAARPIIKLVDHIIAQGISQRASDIHLELQEGGVQVTLRIDGVLRPAMQFPRAVGVPLVSRIKIMSGLDIADRLRPQDGRARVSLNGRRIDLRVSTLPASNGEKVVIRILDAGAVVLELGSLGILAQDLARIERLINLREGIILVTGPTGSGKTTTLYSALKTIQTRGVNIVTVEDPVEYKLSGIVQVQVNEKAGLTFAAALRSILRQDPDVVLVGEIRDRETAGIAIQASLTGHLVLSTLHTIDATTSVARLLDIGVEPYKIGAALKGVIAQRLVRRLCVSCREPVTEALPPKFDDLLPPGTVPFRGVGCPECSGTGYKGRMALVEVLVSDAEVERRVSAGDPSDLIAHAARRAGMRSLWESAMDHVAAGLTDIEEILRVVEIPEPTGPARRPTPASALDVPQMAAGRSSLGSGRHVAVRERPPASDPFRGGGAFELVEDLIAPRPPARTKVLVATADPNERDDLIEHLERDGFAAVGVGDGIQALEEVDQLSPGVVLLDLDLPRLDGLSVLSRLRSRLPTSKLPVILLAASPNDETEAKALDAGGNDFLARPLSPRSLSARLRAQTRR